LERIAYELSQPKARCKVGNYAGNSTKTVIENEIVENEIVLAVGLE
jgi:hypothetical protein